eukprot:1406313-Prorocentrum_lima.AAC.1
MAIPSTGSQTRPASKTSTHVPGSARQRKLPMASTPRPGSHTRLRLAEEPSTSSWSRIEATPP